MGELAASIVHEVTQPLTGIVSNGNACLHWLANVPAERLKRLAARWNGSFATANRASEVIHDIRTLVKKTPPHQEEVDLNDLIYRTLNASERRDDARTRWSYKPSWRSDLPNVLGDRVQLQQVLLNLIMNAIEAMSRPLTGRRLLTIRSATLELRKE